MRAPVLPGARLLFAVAICLASAVLCTTIVRQPPWLGLTFEYTAAGSTLRVAGADEASLATGVHLGDTLVAIAAAGGGPMELEARDLLEEPDFLDTWAEEDAFYGRQTALAAIVGSPAVTLTLRHPGRGDHTATVTPRTRPLGSMPLVFWLQLCFGAAGLIIGTWIWALRPDDWGPRAYAITGICFLIFAHAAAIYSARELALPGTLFRALSGVNHFGAIMFGAALCSIFLVYPLRLTSARVPIGVGVVAFVWWLTCVTRVAPDQNWGSRFPVMLEMLGAIAIAVWQWRRTKGDPAARTVLRWFALSILVGCSAFIGLVATVSAIGGLPPIPQGYAFGFFVLMYAGLAVGLARYRVFSLDQWAYRILFWGIIVAAFIAMDLALIGSATNGAARTLVFATLLAVATLPLRRWVWSRLVDRKEVPTEELFESALHVSYAVSDDERDQRWRALLVKLFDPLRSEDLPSDQSATVVDVDLRDQGKELAVPAVAPSPALRLTYANGGKRLFTPADAQLVRTLVSLMHSANQSRKAYDVGVARERTRIARDLHDTVSSPLLAGLSPLEGGDADGARMSAVQNEIRRAVQGMRSVVRGDSVTAAPLADCVADARFAALERLAAASITVEWPIHDVGTSVLNPEQRHAFTAFMQESITNIIRHSGATHVTVNLSMHDDTLHCEVLDDGRGFSPDPTRTGDGLPNLQVRAATLGGTATIGPRSDGQRGTAVSLVATLASGALQG